LYLPDVDFVNFPFIVSCEFFLSESESNSSSLISFITNKGVLLVKSALSIETDSSSDSLIVLSLEFSIIFIDV
jgi:hypothetical protein